MRKKIFICLIWISFLWIIIDNNNNVTNGLISGYDLTDYTKKIILHAHYRSLKWNHLSLICIIWGINNKMKRIYSKKATTIRFAFKKDHLFMISCRFLIIKHQNIYIIKIDIHYSTEKKYNQVIINFNWWILLKR